MPPKCPSKRAQRPPHSTFTYTTQAQKNDALCKAKANQSTPLLRLPAEIKNMIYDYVLSFPWIWVANREGKKDDGSLWWRFVEKDLGEPPLFLALTLVCRQTYIDTRLIPFAKMTLLIGCLSDFDDWLAKFAPAYLVQLDVLISRGGHCGHLSCLNVPHVPTETDREGCRQCAVPKVRQWRLKELKELRLEVDRYKQNEGFLKYVGEVKKALEGMGVSVEVVWE